MIKKYKPIFLKYWEINVLAISVILLVISYQVYTLFGLTEQESSRLTYSTIATNIVSLMGSVASIVGLIIAYLQIKEIKKKATKTEELTKQTQEEVRNALKMAKEVSSLTEISNTISLIREVQGYLEYGELKPAQLRMKDLKTVLIGIINSKELKTLVILKRFRELRNDFEIDLRNMNSLIVNEKEKVELKVISNNLEEVATELISIQKQLMEKQYV